MNRSLAQLVSFVAHPLLVLTYMLLILLWVDPYAFGVRHVGDPKAVVLTISVFVCTFLLPGIGVLLMKPLGLIKSLEMSDKQERTGPYIVTGVFYLWLVKNLMSETHTPELYTRFVLGAAIGLFLAFFVNIFSKISAHAVGMGGFVAMLLLLIVEGGSSGVSISTPAGAWQFSLLTLLAAGILLAGWTGMARLSLAAHQPADIYRGYAVGFLSVLLANLVG